MLLQLNRSKTEATHGDGKEQSAFILEDGKVLVMPDNWNDRETANYEQAGYTRKNHVLTDSKGNSYGYIGHIHTHPKGADKGMNEYSDDAQFAKADKDIAMYILHADRNFYGGYYSSRRGGLVSWGRVTSLLMIQKPDNKNYLRNAIYLNIH